MSSALQSPSADSLRPTLPYARSADRPKPTEAVEIPAEALAEDTERESSTDSNAADGGTTAARAGESELGVGTDESKPGAAQGALTLEVSSSDRLIRAASATETLRPSNIDMDPSALGLKRKKSPWAWLSAAAGVLLIVGIVWGTGGKSQNAMVQREREKTKSTPVLTANPAHAAMRAARLGNKTVQPGVVPAESGEAVAAVVAVAAEGDGAEPVVQSLSVENGRLKDAFAAALSDGPGVVRVSVRTNPGNAAVFDGGGKHLGAGAVDVSVPAGRERRILVFLHGYHQKRVTLDGKTTTVEVVLSKKPRLGDAAKAGGEAVAAARVSKPKVAAETAAAGAPRNPVAEVIAPEKKPTEHEPPAASDTPAEPEPQKPEEQRPDNPFAEVDPL